MKEWIEVLEKFGWPALGLVLFIAFLRTWLLPLVSKRIELSDSEKKECGIRNEKLMARNEKMVDDFSIVMLKHGENQTAFVKDFERIVDKLDVLIERKK